MLLFALDRSRAQFAWKCGGLDATGLGKPHPPSAMTLCGLLKHIALVEDACTALDLTGQPIGPPWDAVDFDADPDGEWRTWVAVEPRTAYPKLRTSRACHHRLRPGDQDRGGPTTVVP